MAQAYKARFKVSKKADPNVFRQGFSMTRQTRKAFQRILNNEVVKLNEVINLFQTLGFSLRQAGSHKTFTHPKGYRFTLSALKHKCLLPYQICEIKKVLLEIQEKEGECMPIPEADYSLIDPGRESTKEFYDTKAIAERSFKDVTKMDMQRFQGPQAITRDKETADQLKRLSTMLEAVQESLLSLGVEVEDLKAAFQTAKTAQKQDLQAIYDGLVELKDVASTQVPQKADKPKLTPAQIRREKSIKNIKQTMEEHPQFKDNFKVIAVLANSSPDTVQRYREQGLV